MPDGWCADLLFSCVIQWAPDTGAFSVQDMGVDHRRLEVLVIRELLDRADVVAVFQEVRGEGVAERVAGGPLRDARRRAAAFTAFWRTLSWR